MVTGCVCLGSVDCLVCCHSGVKNKDITAGLHSEAAEKISLVITASGHTETSENIREPRKELKKKKVHVVLEIHPFPHRTDNRNY